jgi:signal transduction histidine kinase
VTLHISADAPLPESNGRAVYRVVQEALTNVHKHARGAATEVSVDSIASAVRVLVINQRPVSAGTLLPGSGAGLIGLRERVALLGGSMTAGPTEAGGWRIEARLPIGPAALPDPDAEPGHGQDVAGQDAAWLAS